MNLCCSVMTSVNSLVSLVGIIKQNELMQIDDALRVSFAIRDMPPSRGKVVMDMCLCDRCVRQFYDSTEHYVSRRDLYQEEKDRCDWCSVQNGFDYMIKRINAGLEKVQNLIRI